MPSASCASSVTALGRSTGTSTPWSERQPSSVVSSSSLRIDDRAGSRRARASSSSSSRNTNTRRSTPAWLPARPTPCASAISACMRSTSRRRSSSKSSTSSALQLQHRVGPLADLGEREPPPRLVLGAQLFVDDLAVLLAHTAGQCIQRLCGSTSTTAVRPAFRIAGAAAASARAARAARAPGRSVLATSCARWRPRSRRSGAGPSSVGRRRRAAVAPSAPATPASARRARGPETTIRRRWRNGG